MNEGNGDRKEAGADDHEKRADTRRSKTIRFADPEWELVERAAANRGIPAAEYVRNAAMDAAEGRDRGARCRNGRNDPADLPEHVHRRDAQAR